jgi:hypothetical protein
MTKRKEYTMTEEQYNKLIAACKPVPCMLIGGVATRSPQENANNTWKALGKELGFKYMTVQPSGPDPKKFTAEEA